MRGDREATLADRLVAHGIPAPELEFRLGPFRLDLAWPAARVALELDGHPMHRTPEGRRRDRERDRRLATWGWRTIRTDGTESVLELVRRWDRIAELCVHDWQAIAEEDRARRRGRAARPELGL